MEKKVFVESPVRRQVKGDFAKKAPEGKQLKPKDVPPPSLSAPKKATGSGS